MSRIIVTIIVSFILFISPVLKKNVAFFSLTAQESDSKIRIAKTMVARVLEDTFGYHLLRELTQLGHRLPGSENAARAVRWAKKTMEELELDSVWLQSCPVPHWERGETEEAFLFNSKGHKLRSLSIASLGNSIGTGKMGIKAEVLEVRSFEELHRKKDKAVGKMIFFNKPMDPGSIKTFAAYGRAVDQGTRGAVEAARAGGVAVIVRSVTTKYDNIPHVGVMHYEEGVQRLPAAESLY